MNLVCGVLGVIALFGGRYDIAFYLMLAAAVFDFCDGLAARALNAYSELGKQLDSLSDLVSFGVLPSLMLYRLMSETNGVDIWCHIPLLIAVFSAVRLAKFNIDDRQSDNFIGLPVPASAMICGSFVYYLSFVPDSVMHNWIAAPYFIPVMSLVISWLMVSEIPMFSMKFKKGQKAGTPIYRLRVAFFGILIVSCVITALFGLNWSFIILIVFLAYIVMNVVNLILSR